MRSRIRDPRLADKGMLQIEWAEMHMPVVSKFIRKDFASARPLEGVKVGAVLHVTKETAALVRTLVKAGATVRLAASNPLSTQDEVAAALAGHEGVEVCAWRGMSSEEYFSCIKWVAGWSPNVVVDDGGDLHVTLHEEYPEVANTIWGGTEETTTGVIRLHAMERQGILKYPAIAVNDAHTKTMFDNRYGTGQSSIDGILRATNILLAGKVVVVAGYGWVGRGIALRARGMGARVIVTEVDPIRALEAAMDGYQVMPLREAARLGDIFITATGNKKVIRREHIELMKDGAILANAGHFNVEIWVPDLEELAVEKRKIRNYLEEYRLRDGRRIYLLAEGRLVNLVAAEGHPSEVMDMSFANQALTIRYIVENRGKLKPRVYRVPREIDVEVARLKLKAMGIEIDVLTEEQKEYLQSWRL